MQHAKNITGSAKRNVTKKGPRRNQTERLAGQIASKLRQIYSDVDVLTVPVEMENLLQKLDACTGSKTHPARH